MRLEFYDAAQAYRRKLHMEGRLTLDTERRLTVMERWFSGVALADINAKRINEFLYENYKGRAPSTINRNLAALAAIMAVAEEEGLVLVKPKVKRARGERQRNVHLELDEIMPVVDAVREKEGVLAGFCILLLIDTGMRFGEAMNLRWGDLRPDWVTVREAEYRNSKTVARTIPTSPRLLEYMVKYGILPTTATGANDPLITSQWTNNRTQIGLCLNRYLRQACVDTGAACGINIKLHDLRHTFAFLCASAGADLADIKDLLGHATLQMTMRYRGFVKSRAAIVVRKAMSVTPPSGITGLEGVRHEAGS